MTKFYVCEVLRDTPCTFSERTMGPLWKRTGGDIARCVRHGALITSEVWAESIEEARRQVKKETEIIKCRF
jgi:hypothetical protein